ncbi:hypothetical protein CEXT_334151 [Caerostris extrusa]|uniref:Uncharacterized protein n=1 Tax=Caerostris extrusa TaxID=172846 RepID=A0AAV4XXH6_CAEEX|nr:hypothetical protein CEXT_334151 [Caerostris extrusa]
MEIVKRVNSKQKFGKLPFSFVKYVVCREIVVNQGTVVSLCPAFAVVNLIDLHALYRLDRESLSLRQSLEIIESLIVQAVFLDSALKVRRKFVLD